MKNGANRIQRSWRRYSQHKKEKEAALVIEKFFITVQEEVEREMARIEQSKKHKRHRKRQKKKEAEDKLLERVWLNTVNSEDGHRVRAASSNNENERKERLSKSGSLLCHPPGPLQVKQNGSTEIRTNEGKSSRELLPPTETIHADDHSEVSGITSPTVFLKEPLVSIPSRFKNLSRKELRDDLSLEEAWIDTEVHQAKEKMRSEKKYIKKYGLDRSGGHVVTSKRDATTNHRGESSVSASKKGSKHSYPRPVRRGSSSGSISSRDPSGSRVQRGKKSVRSRSRSPAPQKIRASSSTGDLDGVSSSRPQGRSSSGRTQSRPRTASRTRPAVPRYEP
jgi:hypothetical protein